VTVDVVHREGRCPCFCCFRLRSVLLGVAALPSYCGMGGLGPMEKTKPLGDDGLFGDVGSLVVQ
jgi:hypothetical protein